MLATLLDELGIQGWTLHLNSVGSAADRARYNEALRAALVPVVSNTVLFTSTFDRWSYSAGSLHGSPGDEILPEYPGLLLRYYHPGQRYLIHVSQPYLQELRVFRECDDLLLRWQRIEAHLIYGCSCGLLHSFLFG